MLRYGTKCQEFNRHLVSGFSCCKVRKTCRGTNHISLLSLDKNSVCECNSSPHRYNVVVSKNVSYSRLCDEE